MSTSNPLPSWNEGSAKQAILDFVALVTKEDGPDFVPENERIAVFDSTTTARSGARCPFPSRRFSPSTA